MSIKMEKRICGNPPALVIVKHFYCDQCGAEGYPDGIKEEKIFQVNETGEHLCYECLFDWLTLGTIQEIV